VFDQLRDAVVSVEANIVEGYVLGSPAQFRRHLRYALALASEAECLIRLAAERRYLPADTADELESAAGLTLRLVTGLIRRIDRSDC
jgi:four helix bundle protein